MSSVKTMAAAVLSFAAFQANAALMITGVVDATLPGGTPKVIELFAMNDIADLSVYGLESANNDNLPSGIELNLSGSVSAGDFIYVTTAASVEDNKLFNTFGVNADFVDGVASINGDDTIVLYKDGAIIDIMGEGTDGTGSAWDHVDGWAYRVNGTSADGSFDLANWTFSGTNALDGLSAAELGAAVPLGTYTAASAVPVPAAAWLFGSALMGLLGLRRKQ